ncbi:MAG TPA: hypothetical protein VND62_02170 [Acidimicrobiales bacterium]|nr:hypothetical protein [Acidimicrobiales bacterium]
MLLLGTTHHLEDLDRQFTIAEDLSVGAIAVAGGAGAPSAYVLADGDRIARVDELELAPVAVLGNGKAQSLAATGGGLLVGLEGAQLAQLSLTGGGLSPVESFAAVPGRATWENPAAATPDLRSLAVTPTGTWLVNVHVGGVWRSTDTGRTWTNVVPPDDDVHEVVAGGAGVVVAAAARGFGWSVDDGMTWQWTTDGLHAPYCRAVAGAGDRAFVTASTGPRSRDGRVFAGRLGGSFTVCRGGLPESFPYNLDTGTLAASGDEVAVGTPDGLVWRSRDGGESFGTVTERVGHVRVLRFG